jgi:hypothetical protein
MTCYVRVQLGKASASVHVESRGTSLATKHWTEIGFYFWALTKR